MVSIIWVLEPGRGGHYDHAAHTMQGWSTAQNSTGGAQEHRPGSKESMHHHKDTVGGRDPGSKHIEREGTKEPGLQFSRAPTIPYHTVPHNTACSPALLPPHCIFIQALAFHTLPHTMAGSPTHTAAPSSSLSPFREFYLPFHIPHSTTHHR